MKLKKGDNVIVKAGKDKGVKGAIERVLPDRHQVVINGVNKQKIHRRKRGAKEPGQIVERSAPIDISNVMLVDPKTGLGTRVGYRFDDKTGKKIRVAKKSGSDLK